MKRLLIVFIILSVILPLSAQNVDKKELFKVSKDSVEFFNYVGPYSKFETAAQIRGIGSALGKELSRDLQRSDYFSRYRVFHIIDKNGEGLLNADIFSIEKDAVVDNITNVRRILSGYLESFYGYRESDAKVIAEFITYYNAFYRKNIDYFKTVYAGKVISVLDPEKAGISTRYNEWPGKTQMLIPLSPGSGQRVHLSTVSNKDVIENLRIKPDKGIEPRKAMVEVKEKEITAEQNKIELARKALEKEKKALEKKKAAVGESTGTPTEKKKALAEIVTKETKVTAAEQEIKKQEAENANRQKSVQQEREQIAKDEKQLIEKKKDSLSTGTITPLRLIPFLYVENNNSDLMGRFVLIDSTTGAINRKSTLNTVRGRKFLLVNDSLIFISGVDKPPRAVRLMTMNKETLEVEDTGVDDIYSGSELVYKNGYFYSVTRKEGKWYAARFDTHLKLQSRSVVEVLPITPLQFNTTKLYVQTKTGVVKALDSESLKVLP